MRHLAPLLLTLACTNPVDTAPDVDTESDSDVDTQVDQANPYVADCDARPMLAGDTTQTGECTTSDTLPNGLTRVRIRPRCTDPEITAVSNKHHLLILPETPTRDVLWVHLPGTGGEPPNTERFGTAVARAGYRYIGLAYPNDQNMTDRCSCPDGPRPAECKDLARHEVITGQDVTPWFDMQADEAIVPRLEALLATLHEQRPNDGWDAFLDDDGHPVWSSIAMSGFSQGGVHVGRIGRDHALDRQVHFSSINDAVLTVVLDPDTAQSCESHEECDGMSPCCTVDAYPCNPVPDDAICIEGDHDPSSWLGADTDNDAVGDGDFTTRATPLDRIFVFVHTLEPAWDKTPDLLDQWGLGGEAAFIDADANRGPYPADARFFSTSREPNGGGCSYHQAMGPDGCLPRDRDGEVALLPAWRHAIEMD